MLKNRYFKTTQGVPFELVIGKTTATLNQNTTLFKSITGVVGNIYPIRRESASTSVAPYVLSTAGAWNAGTGVPTANLKQNYITFANCTVAGAWGTSKWNMTTPVLANTISVTNIPYAAGTPMAAKITASGSPAAVGQIIRFKIIETTPGNQNLPVWDYEYLVTTAAIATYTPAFATAITNKINKGLEGEWFTVTGTADTNTSLTVTSTDATRTFRLSYTVEETKAGPTTQAWVATYTVTTAPVYPSGSADQIAQLIQEDAVRRGVGHYYPQQAATAAEFGLPDWSAMLSYVGASPSIVLITGQKTEASPTPAEQHVNNQAYIVVICDATTAGHLVAMFPGN